MPELPEVELAARQLREWLVGQTIAAIEVVDPKVLGDGDLPVWHAGVAGRSVLGVERRAKYLLLRFSGDQTVVAHLRMTGRFRLERAGEGPLALPVRLALRRARGAAVLFSDARRFGRLWLASGAAAERLPELARLGPDALLDPPAAGRLAGILRGRTASVKSILMDQRHLGGLGNICAIEILHRAGIAPWRPGGEVTAAEVDQLAAIIPEYLRWAIERQSRRELIYLGERGAENVFQIYRRAGQPCPRCPGTIERALVVGRGTFFCRGCQR
jgi:formamidopyrimidine-DNA glycosylase